MRLAQLRREPVDAMALQAALRQLPESHDQLPQLLAALAQQSQWQKPQWSKHPDEGRLPCIVIGNEGQLGIVTARTPEGLWATSWWLPETKQFSEQSETGFTDDQAFVRMRMKVPFVISKSPSMQLVWSEITSQKRIAGILTTANPIVANSSGVWSYTLNSTDANLLAADTTFTVRQKAAGGSIWSPASASYQVVFDNAAPAGVPTVVLSTNSDTFGANAGSNTDGITSSRTLILGGAAEANAYIDLLDNGVKIATLQADSTGAWTTTLSNVSAAKHNYTARQFDAAGNATAFSNATVVSVDVTATAPTAAVLDVSTDTGAIGDRITTVTTPKLNGTGAEPGAVISVFDGANLTPVATATVQANGSWSVNTSALTVGAHNLRINQTDLAGNTSALSAPLSLNIVAPITVAAPSAPVLTAATDTGLSQTDQTTNATALVFTGTPVADTTLVAGESVVSGTNGVNALTGTTGDDSIVGYGGPVALAGTASATGDTLTGNGGQDTFVYRKGNVGKDTITDFTLGATGNSDVDKLNFADLLQGYDPANIADFVRLEADATTGQVSVKVDYNGKADGSVFTPYLQVDLTGVTLAASGTAYGTTQADLDALRAAMMSNGQLILV